MITKNDDFWKEIIWSDESKFELQSKRRQYVWRKVGEEYDQACIQTTVKYPGKVNVWGCFSWHGLGELVVIDGNLDAKQFVSILHDNLQLSAHSMGFGDQYIFQQDNDPNHT